MGLVARREARSREEKKKEINEREPELMTETSTTVVMMKPVLRGSSRQRQKLKHVHESAAPGTHLRPE